MKLYRFLSCLPASLLPTVVNSLPAIDNNAQLGLSELDSTLFAGNFDSQLPPSDEQSSTAQVDANLNPNPLLFSLASENPSNQIENFPQTSIAGASSSGSDGSVCDNESESGHGSKNANKNRIRRDGAMCAAKGEGIDWDGLWATFSKTREQTSGQAPACTDPHYPVHLCCRGSQSKYLHNLNLFRRVNNCAPCKLSFYSSWCHTATPELLISALL